MAAFIKFDGLDGNIDDPHTQARDMEVTLEHPVEGTIKALGIPVKLSDTPGTIRRPAPTCSADFDWTRPRGSSCATACRSR